MRKILALLWLSATLPLAAQSLTDYVDPMIGTAGHGHVFVGAHVPYGMVNAGPTQLETGWDWCSGYHYSGRRIVGFAQTHLSGTGCSDLGDVALMPASGEVELSREGLASPFRHDTEEVRPGYYKVVLDDSKIRCQITSTRRVAYHRYTWAKGSGNARIVVDLQNGVGDRPLHTRIMRMDEQTLVGYRISRGWAAEQQVYFCIQFSRPMSDFLVRGLDTPYGEAVFTVGPGETVEAKVALSPVSEVNALHNMASELPDVEVVRLEALSA